MFAPAGSCPSVAAALLRRRSVRPRLRPPPGPGQRRGAVVPALGPGTRRWSLAGGWPIRSIRRLATITAAPSMAGAGPRELCFC